MSADNLARFRADPSKVRVSVRPSDGRWRLRVESRSNPERDNAETFDSDPGMGLVYLLEVASSFIEGVDLGMEWTYPHPMKAAQ
jgi:hypothetical protein